MKYLFLSALLIYSTASAASLNSAEPIIKADESKLYNNIVTSYEQKKYNEALKHFTKLKTPHSAAFDYLKGIIYLEQKQYSNAEKAFHQALKKMPQFIRPHQALIKTYFDSDRAVKALPHLSEIIKQGRANGNTWKSLAEIQLNEKNYDAAWHAIQQARIFSPQDQNLENILLDIRLQQENYREAIPMLKAAIDKNPQQRQLWLSLSSCLLKTDKTSEARLNLELFSRLLNCAATKD